MQEQRGFEVGKSSIRGFTGIAAKHSGHERSVKSGSDRCGNLVRMEELEVNQLANCRFSA